MTAIHAQTERKRQDRSVRCAEKHRRRARTRRLRGLIRPVPAACATEDTGWGEKCLSSGQNQAIFTSASMPLGQCRLKTFDTNQQTVLANQIARILKPGGSFSLIEASDPKGWILRPLYRFYLDGLLPQIERLFLKGAHDFSMIGTYTRNFESRTHMAEALRNAGLTVSLKKHVFGCATSVAGHKPSAISEEAP